MLETHVRHSNPEIQIVSSPDHPLLLTPPDMLVAKRGRINAYYSIKALEKNSPKHLLSRLVLSRRALPTYSQHILVATNDVDTSLINRLSEHFEEVINTSEINQSFSILDSINPNKRAIDRASIGRDRHYIKYNLMYQLSLLQLRSSNEEKREIEIDSQNYEHASYINWIDSTLTQNPIVVESKYFQRMAKGYFTIPEFEGSRRRIELLKKICLSSMQLDATYDNGVMVNVYDEVKLILSQAIPGYRHDELKGVRGAAFAGLGLSHARSSESMNKYSEFISYQLERDLSEYNKKKNRHNHLNRHR